MANKGKRDEMRILTEEQAVALREVLSQKYVIHPDCRQQYYHTQPLHSPYPEVHQVLAPELGCKPFDLVNVVMSRLLAHGVPITSVRLNGGAASHVLMTTKIEDRTFNDLDIVFMLAEEKSLSEFAKIWETIRTTIMGLLREYVMGAIHDANPSREYLQSCPDHILEQIYVQKLVMIPKWHHDRESMALGADEDCWSLICFRNDEGRNVEFKFVNRLRRCYEFPTDSFQIILNEEVLGGRDTPGARVGEASQGEPKDQASYAHKVQYLSCHTGMDEALDDLKHSRLGIHKPEEIRGGGFLRYIQLRMKGAALRDSQKDQEEKNERLMLNRFLLDFRSQAAISHVLDNFIRCHFPQKTNINNMNASIEFLDLVREKVEKSRIHERNLENDSTQTTEFLRAVFDHRCACEAHRDSYQEHLREMAFHQRQQQMHENRRSRGPQRGNPPVYQLEPRYDSSRGRHPQMEAYIPPHPHYQFQQVRWPLSISAPTPAALAPSLPAPPLRPLPAHLTLKPPRSAASLASGAREPGRPEPYWDDTERASHSSSDSQSTGGATAHATERSSQAGTSSDSAERASQGSSTQVSSEAPTNVSEEEGNNDTATSSSAAESREVNAGSTSTSSREDNDAYGVSTQFDYGISGGSLESPDSNSHELSPLASGFVPRECGNLLQPVPLPPPPAPQHSPPPQSVPLPPPPFYYTHAAPPTSAYPAPLPTYPAPPFPPHYYSNPERHVEETAELWEKVHTGSWSQPQMSRTDRPELDLSWQRPTQMHFINPPPLAYHHHATAWQSHHVQNDPGYPF